jgi:Histidine kinase-, DNA gyrase B-, and HSP90-like ATPase
VISTAQGALEKPFQRVLNGLRLRTPLDNDTSRTALNVPLVALAVGGLSEGPLLVHLNTSQLRQLFLIGSTIEYTDKGVKAESSAMPMDHSPTASHRTMDMVDTGVGIASEDQFRILDLFFQAGWATAQSGTGLGLSICRQYTKLTGRMVLEGTLGKESRFHLELAVRRADTGEVAAARNEGKRIIGLEHRTTGASHLNRRKPIEELAGARRCISTGRVRRASRKGQRAGCLNVSDLAAATYLDELASASFGRAGGCAPHPAPGMRKGWQNCTSKHLSVWFSACRGVSPRFRSARTHIVPARSLGKPGLAARCGAAIRRSPASVDRVTLPAEAMATIHEELRNKTIDALILLDTEQSIPNETPRSARRSSIAARFAYTPILYPAQTCIMNDGGGKNESR